MCKYAEMGVRAPFVFWTVQKVRLGLIWRGSKMAGNAILVQLVGRLMFLNISSPGLQYRRRRV